MKITRRQFLQYCTASAAALGLSQMDLLKLEKALAAEVCECNDYDVPHVIWIQGQSCGGCTLSILNRMRTEYPPELLTDWTPTALDGPTAPVQDVVDLLVGDAVGAVTGGVRSGWANFPDGYISLDYNSEVSAAAGDLITNYIECLEANTHFFVAQSGAIPLMDPHVNTPLGRQPFSVAGSFQFNRPPDYTDTAKEEKSVAQLLEFLATSPNCLGVVAFGTCASFGGIPAAYGNVCASTGCYNFLVNYAGHSELADKIVNVPGCAPHPDWMIYPIAYYILNQGLPALDGTLKRNRVWLGQTQVFTNQCPKNTPRAIYTSDKGYTNFCDVCEKYDSTGTKQCSDLGAGPGNGDGTNQKEWCTRTRGCNGPFASPDCPTRRWNNFDDNSPNSWCVGANYVCQGCAEPDFPDARSPFFEATKNSQFNS